MQKTVSDRQARARRGALPPTILRRGIAALLVAATVLTPLRQPQASGIPVVDAASIADRALRHAATMAKYVEQIKVLRNQLDGQRRQLESMTGTRNLGELFSQSNIRELLPTDARDALQPHGAPNRDLSLEIARVKLDEMSTSNYTATKALIDERAARLAVRSQAMMRQSQRAMSARATQLDRLQREINQAQDPKAIADLQARLMVEQANIQVDQTRADLLKRQLDSEQLLLAQQAKEHADRSLSIRAIRAPIPRGR